MSLRAAGWSWEGYRGTSREEKRQWKDVDDAGYYRYMETLLRADRPGEAGQCAADRAVPRTGSTT